MHVLKPGKFQSDDDESVCDKELRNQNKYFALNKKLKVPKHFQSPKTLYSIAHDSAHRSNQDTEKDAIK